MSAARTEKRSGVVRASGFLRSLSIADLCTLHHDLWLATVDEPDPKKRMRLRRTAWKVDHELRRRKIIVSPY